MELAVKLKNIKKSYGIKDVLHIEELTVYQNERIGIVGSNGSGKSTLLRLLKGEIQPDSGQVQREIDFLYYPQIPQAGLITPAKKELDGELISRFGLTKNTPGLSGGEQAKFRLAELLSGYEMGLLLDEPTTHLDITGIQLLVEELRYYYGTLLFISHDRTFLNELATKIWEVQDGQVTVYSGNYDAYQEQKALQEAVTNKAQDQYQKEKQRLEAAVAAKKAQAEKSRQLSAKKRQKNIRPDRLSSSKQKDTVEKNLQKTAKALASRLEQLQAPESSQRLQKIKFPPSKTVALHNKYPFIGTGFTLKREEILLEQVDFQFALGEKIAIVGANGVGKSSFLNAILENNEHIIRSPKVVCSIYQQLAYQLQGPESVLHYLMKQTEYPEKLVRSILHNLGFSPGEVHKPLTVLSGGEATRVELASVFVRPANVLLLDEPTNFIDLATIEALENLIQAYPGTVLFTSHDQAFVDKVATQVYQICERQLVRIR